MKRALLLALPVLLLTPIASASEFNVTFSDTFTEKLEEDYGLKEGEYLANEIREDLARYLAKAGLTVSQIDVVIEDARPNKPTMKQLGDELSLDYGRSISTGGMKLTLSARDADKNVIASLTDDDFENDLRFASPTTWGDANTASSRITRKFVKQIAALETR
ncbi:MAG: hypothetical protein ACRBEQ_11965 [Hyphomonas sp.]